ncbi:MAG: 5-deoxy-glucuronate isomerase [Lachnospiraceae bacterium]
MSELFSYPEFNPEGVRVLSRAGDRDNDMMMDITVYRMKAGEKRIFAYSQQEMALLLVTGDLTFAWEGQEVEGKRNSLIEEGPYCLHVAKGVTVSVTAKEESEVLVQCTENDRTFTSVFYKPETCTNDIFGEGLWENKMKRTVRTIFDYNNAPYSNMVNGEVITHQGGWSSYVPHEHAQPEVYYYRYERPEGFGACFIGEDAFKIKDGSCAAITGGKTHPQVTAPGYPMYYCWMIRHLEGDPWTTRVDDPRYDWIK